MTLELERAISRNRRSHRLAGLLRSNGTSFIGLQVLAAVMALPSSSIMARQLGPADLGAYTTQVRWVALALVIGSVSLGQAYAQAAAEQQRPGGLQHREVA